MRKLSTELKKMTAMKLRRNGLKIEAGLREGHPRTEIVDEARKWRADLIVLGARMDIRASNVCSWECGVISCEPRALFGGSSTAKTVEESRAKIDLD